MRTGRERRSAREAPQGSPYVTRELCERIHAEQREANRRTWEELRTLRRLVIAVVLGGQLLAAGLNVAGLAYWLEQHSEQTHPATARTIETVRREARQDVRELRGELRAALGTILGRLGGGEDAAPARTDKRKEADHDG